MKKRDFEISLFYTYMPTCIINFVLCLWRGDCGLHRSWKTSFTWTSDWLPVKKSLNLFRMSCCDSLEKEKELTVSFVKISFYFFEVSLIHGWILIDFLR